MISYCPFSLVQFRAAIRLQFDFHRAIYNLGTVLVSHALTISFDKTLYMHAIQLIDTTVNPSLYYSMDWPKTHLERGVQETAKTFLRVSYTANLPSTSLQLIR